MIPPVIQPPEPPQHIVSGVAVEPPATAEGGREEQLARVTQNYQRALLTRIQAERRYPRAALLDGFEGNGAIQFTIARDGQLLESAVAATTGSKSLDRATLSLVHRAAPFPAIPSELPDALAVTMPIRFLIVRQHSGGEAR